jgi:hypothetical protein
MIDDERHKDVGRDGEACERAGADLADKQETGDDRESANDATERRPPRHCAYAFDSWQRAWEAEPQDAKQGDHGQERNEARQPGVVSEFLKRPFIGGPQACKATATRTIGWSQTALIFSI